MRDLGDPTNLERYEKAVKKSIRKLGIKPAIVACDLHPGYFSRQFAHGYTKYDVRSTMYEYKMVCKDGPVFDAEEIAW